MVHAQGSWHDSYVRGLNFTNQHGITTEVMSAILLEGTGGNLIQHWSLTGNTFKNFARHIMTSGADDVAIDDNDFVMERGRDSGPSTNEAQLDAILASNTLVGNAAPDRLRNGSF